MSETLSQSFPLKAEEKSAKSTGPDEIRWVTVAHTFGITQAMIVVGRLHAEGVPARAWQEGAGQATGLIVGKLGTGYVVVPEAYEEEARAILAQPVTDINWEDAGWDEEE
ncbi:MAG: hypothetical protein IPF56_19545 [Chloroflexi bacterium]|nr:hypothetical protein [Chloroflexota bacterium]MBK6712854.1 hypothetical protein [Chloroflexota bacterium]MBK7177542.1 hypothetical protein [Chloroflexota bacterium]MBK7918770.1 hypothetical protein [Chloroflexota bacterium]MBK8931846.1 hypothetical protein [Chloroflexota bacterium]